MATKVKTEKILHLPAPGPMYWSWRCRICDEAVADHGSWFQILMFNLRKKK